MGFELTGKTEFTCTEHQEVRRVGCPVCQTFHNFNNDTLRFKIARENFMKKLLDYLRTRKVTIIGVK
jgi:hypothetical protein